MNLNDTQAFQSLDTENMIAHIDGLPDQMQQAWQLGNSSPLPAWEQVAQIVIAGMGGSAIGGDLLAAYTLPHCRVPLVVHRDYGLPAWARGPQTLVIASSHSGNTEEVLDSLTKLKAGAAACWQSLRAGRSPARRRLQALLSGASSTKGNPAPQWGSRSACSWQPSPACSSSPTHPVSWMKPSMPCESSSKTSRQTSQMSIILPNAWRVNW